jgi:sporulation protein YqfC
MDMKAKRNAPALEWLCDLSGRAARVTSMGNRSLLVENHRGILDFGTERIILATGCGKLQVEGEGLSLSEVRRDALVITGDVRCVNFPCGKEAQHEA